MSVVDFIIKMNLTDKLNGFVPVLIDTFLEWLDTEKINIWSYAVEDKSEIKDINKVVLVEDIKGNKRYFETYITEVF